MRLERKRGFYEKYMKRLLDVICALLAMLVFSWLYVIIAVMVRVNLGAPVLFKQPRPGMIDPKTGRERIFYMYKFRTMTDKRDPEGNPLPDEQRLTPFGRKLRASSLDELPGVFNILAGHMSVIGPRPQLVRDMVFMTDAQRMRHTAKPGLSGLAQLNGRNAISWEEKLAWDLEYIKHVTFIGDLKIVLATAVKVFGNHESLEELDVADDYGDYLLKSGKISDSVYLEKQGEAETILTGRRKWGKVHAD